MPLKSQFITSEICGDRASRKDRGKNAGSGLNLRAKKIEYMSQFKNCSHCNIFVETIFEANAGSSHSELYSSSSGLQLSSHETKKEASLIQVVAIAASSVPGMCPISSAVSKILSGDDLCRLCFNRIDEKAVSIQDEVVLNINRSESSEDVSRILCFLLGGQISDNMSNFDSVCNLCTNTAINSYKFIKMCQHNSELLTKAVDTLNDCVENTTDDLAYFKTLFLMVDSKACTSQQFYDTQRLANACATAFIRFQSIAYEKEGARKETQPKQQKKKKIHNFSAETFEICNVIRDNNSRSKFECKVCSNLFNKLSNFKKHYYSQHSPKVIKCLECPRSYGSEALLKQHKYDCHASMVCSKCGKTYTNRYSLLYHMRRHTGEQPYACSFCDLKFQWASRRAEHIRRVHMEPSLECNICHTKFRALGSLYEHRKRHFNPSSRLYVTQT